MNGVQGQFFVVLVFIVLGILLGMVFDFIKAVRNNWKPPKVIRLCIDIWYWAFVFFLVAAVLLSVNWGEVRGYVFLSMGIGIVIYFMWISPGIMTGYSVLFGIFEKVIQKVIKQIYLIINLFYKWTKKE